MPSSPSNESNNWTVTVEEDPATGDLLLPFPPDLLSQMGWAEGTELWWEVDEKGQIHITDKSGSSEKEVTKRT